LSASKLLSETGKYFNQEDQDKVSWALNLANNVHNGFFRKSGDPYVTHAIDVARILASWKAPVHIITSGLLHDIQKTKYSSDTSLSVVEKKLGLNVIEILDDLSVLGRQGFYSKPRNKEYLDTGELINVEQLPWVSRVLRRNPEAIVVKMADRLANIQTLHVLDRERAISYAARDMRIFAPLADRLGMRATMRTIEDSSFSILQPANFKEIGSRLKVEISENERNTVIQEIQEFLAGRGAKLKVGWAPISKISLHRHELEYGKSSLLYSVTPLLIEANSVDDCYWTLGLVHSYWAPQPYGLRDYIASPKNNGFRSLITKVHFRPDKTIQVVIRDSGMSLVAEYGITSEWLGAPKEYLPSLPKWPEPTENQIVVFTQDGDVQVLRKGATPLDFAYSIHPSVGHQFEKAIINDEISPPDQILRTGDVVKIITTRDRVGPIPDWLDIVRTTKARKAISNWIKRQSHQDTADKGWQILNALLNEKGLSLKSKGIYDVIKKITREMELDSIHKLLVNIGLEHINANDVVQKIEGLGYREKSVNISVNSEISILGDNWMPGAIIEISGYDRVGLISDISKAVAEAGISIAKFCAYREDSGEAKITIELRNITNEQLRYIQLKLANISDISNIDPQPMSKQEISYSSPKPKIVSNPYGLHPVFGRYFFGRSTELSRLQSILDSIRGGGSTLLWGPRRIGKTSLLFELERRLLDEDKFIPVLIDMQKVSGRKATDFLHEIMKKISADLDDEDISPPNYSRLKRNPLGYFQSFIEFAVYPLEKPMVIILDEFQYLDTLLEDYISLENVFRHFRNLILNNKHISFIFCGGGHYRQLIDQVNLTTLMEVVHDLRVGCLEHKDAKMLITDPVNWINYDAEAVEMLIELTDGHPYYLQLICRELLYLADQEEIKTITHGQILEILNEWLLNQEEDYFGHLWGEGIVKSKDELNINKATCVSIALVSNSHNDRWVCISEMLDSGISIIVDEKQIYRSLASLTSMDSVEQNIDDDKYRIKFQVFEKWLKGNYSIERIIREIVP